MVTFFSFQSLKVAMIEGRREKLSQGRTEKITEKIPNKRLRERKTNCYVFKLKLPKQLDKVR